MTYLRQQVNEFGTSVSAFECDTCGAGYTICPEPLVEQRWMWQNCMTPECQSYDVSRDVVAIVGFGWGDLRDKDNNTITLTHEGRADD